MKDFNLPEVSDPDEKARRQAALKANEALIKEENEAYSRGEKTWFDAVNKFADLPEDEFELEKTGLKTPPASRTYGRGLLEPSGADRVDFASEQYFADFRRQIQFEYLLLNSMAILLEYNQAYIAKILSIISKIMFLTAVSNTDEEM